MREILFRGKREDNGAWIEGYLVLCPSAIQAGERSSPWAIYRAPRDPDDYGERAFVDENTVGQFTGLADKNGRRIFEGDVVLHKGDERGVITYDKETARFCVSFDTWCTDFDHLYGKELEVV